ncbi:CHERP [Acanthosepion pharaonis]|uniref:CHERP n=1 Tax=Acanthosepion pharaonis TaxID=158019 RepID=A0A812CWD6_ACAPH|nr:CHERP [Sepia pharaonis]
MDIPNPPEDLEQKNIIDKLANFVARNGPEFEQMTKQKQKDNAKFSFLFGGEYYQYYQYKVNAERSGKSHPFQEVPAHPGLLQSTHILPDAGPNFHYQANGCLVHVPRQDKPQDALKQQQALVQHAMSQQVIPPTAPWQATPPPAGGPMAPLPQGPPAGAPQTPLSSLQQQLQQQLSQMQEQIKQSEQNLNAQYQSLIQQQQIQIEEAIVKARKKKMDQLSENCEIDLEELDKTVQPIIESCTKDAILNGKSWIFTHCVSEEHCELIAQYLLNRITDKDSTFDVKLHLIYLINDLLHHCQRKNADELKTHLEGIVVPAFCTASVHFTEDKKQKLTKLLNLWESNKYFDTETIEKLKNPVDSVANYQANLITEYGSIVTQITAAIQAQYAQLQKQHQDFASHLNIQLQQRQQQLQLLQQGGGPPPQTGPGGRENQVPQSVQPSGVLAGAPLAAPPQQGVPQQGVPPQVQQAVSQVPQQQGAPPIMPPNLPNNTASSAPPGITPTGISPSTSIANITMPPQQPPPNSRPGPSQPPPVMPGATGPPPPQSMPPQGMPPQGMPPQGMAPGVPPPGMAAGAPPRGAAGPFPQGPPPNMPQPGAHVSSGTGGSGAGGPPPPNFGPPNFGGPPPPFGPPIPNYHSRPPIPGPGPGPGPNQGPGHPPPPPQLFEYGHGMLPPPPQEFSGPPNGPHPPAGPLPMPDFSKPPPGFPQAPPPIPLPTEMDLTPSVPYYELPAGLMAPLVKLEDTDYKPLDSKDIRLPPPMPPSERLLAAVEAFYSNPSHDRPRDSEGWEKLGLYEFFKAKQKAKKLKDRELEKEKEKEKQSQQTDRFRSRSRSQSPPRPRSRSNSPRSRPPRRSHSRSRSRSKSKSPLPYLRSSKSRSPSPARNRRRSCSTTPPSFANENFGPGTFDQRIGEDNKGHQLLMKMGWSGKGLGVTEQGIVDPIAGGECRDRQNLYKGIGFDIKDPFEQFRMKQEQVKKELLLPLVKDCDINPRPANSSTTYSRTTRGRLTPESIAIAFFSG